MPTTAADGTFTNPVINADFPDPFVTSLDGTYHAYATGTGGKLIQVATSTDLVSWSQPSEALSREPRWMAGSTWAPEVFEMPAGYVMYYTGRSAIPRPDGDGAQCLSVAVANQPVGPFADESDEPLVCQADLGGSIDATVAVAEDGTSHLIWKNDGNCCGMQTRFYAQELSHDGLSLVGNEPVDLGIENDATWEGGVIEAPTVLEMDGRYYLFYSANAYETYRYAVGYATSDSITGPYTDAPENPILSTQRPATAVGPGHQSIFAADDGDLWMAYHAWDVSGIGYDLGGRRALWLDELVFERGKPDVLGPDASPQPVP
jgi:beta-xylosidase